MGAVPIRRQGNRRGWGIWGLDPISRQLFFFFLRKMRAVGSWNRLDLIFEGHTDDSQGSMVPLATQLGRVLKVRPPALRARTRARAHAFSHRACSRATAVAAAPPASPRSAAAQPRWPAGRLQLQPGVLTACCVAAGARSWRIRCGDQSSSAGWRPMAPRFAPPPPLPACTLPPHPSHDSAGRPAPAAGGWSHELATRCRAWLPVRAVTNVERLLAADRGKGLP